MYRKGLLFYAWGIYVEHVEKGTRGNIQVLYFILRSFWHWIDSFKTDELDIPLGPVIIYRLGGGGGGAGFSVKDSKI